MQAIKLIVGLGNPGPQYSRNRHNVGFQCVELLAQRHGLRLDKMQQRAMTGSGVIPCGGERHKVLLARPLTYMNSSGEAVAPLARYAKQPLLIRTRRLLGLWCFAWATLHLTSYALLELGINNLTLLGRELVTRPYLTLGIVSWLVLLALALTSTQYAQRKLGRRWQLLHNFVYLVAILAPIHYLWSVKILSPQPVLYALAAVALLAWRYKKFRQWLR